MATTTTTKAAPRQQQLSGYYREEFGRVARFYDAGVGLAFRLIGGEHAFRCQIVKTAELKPDSQVLDLSCGTGTLVQLMAGCLGPEGGAVGVDLSEHMLEVARGKAVAGNVQFIQANAEDLPFPDSSFDRVTISLGIHEMNRQGRENALAEMRRVLKRGGLLVVADMRRPDKWFNKLGMKFVGLVETDTLSDMWRGSLYREIGHAGFDHRRRRIVGHDFFEIIVARKCAV